MSTRTITTSNGSLYELVNHSWRNSKSWGHETNLFINGVETLKNRATYINRTWEAYQYQSSMKNSIHRVRDSKLVAYIDNRKVDEGIKRLASATREQWTEEFISNHSDLQEVLDKL